MKLSKYKKNILNNVEIYDLAPKIWSMRGLQSLRPPNPPWGRPRYIK